MKTYSNEDGELHRVNGPAVEWGDYYAWCYNGQRHRYYGSALHYSRYEYWIFDKQII